jgi:hypothetical protein
VVGAGRGRLQVSRFASRRKSERAIPRERKRSRKPPAGKIQQHRPHPRRNKDTASRSKPRLPANVRPAPEHLLTTRSKGTCDDSRSWPGHTKRSYRSVSPYMRRQPRLFEPTPNAATAPCPPEMRLSAASLRAHNKRSYRSVSPVHPATAASLRARNKRSYRSVSPEMRLSAAFLT